MSARDSFILNPDSDAERVLSREVVKFHLIRNAPVSAFVVAVIVSIIIGLSLEGTTQNVYFVIMPALGVFVFILGLYFLHPHKFSARKIVVKHRDIMALNDELDGYVVSDGTPDSVLWRAVVKEREALEISARRQEILYAEEQRSVTSKQRNNATTLGVQASRIRAEVAQILEGPHGV